MTEGERVKKDRKKGAEAGAVSAKVTTKV